MKYLEEASAFVEKSNKKTKTAGKTEIRKWICKRQYWYIYDAKKFVFPMIKTDTDSKLPTANHTVSQL